MEENEKEAKPALPAAMYPAADDHKTYAVDLELGFFHGEILVKDGNVIDAPQMLKWTQEHKDGEPRQMPLKDVIEWYKRPGKLDKEGNEKLPEFRAAEVVAVLDRE